MANRTLATLQQDVLDELGESVGFYTLSNLTRWLNDGVVDVSHRVEPNVTSAFIDLTHTTQEFALPDDLISLKKVLAKEDTDAQWVELSDQYTWEDLFERVPGWEDETPSMPTHYYWRDDTIGVYPMKASPSVSCGLRILYAYVPAPMSDPLHLTGIPDYLDKVVVQYAAWRARLKDKDKQAAMAAQQAYLVGATAAGQKINLIQKRHQPRITVDSAPYRDWYSHRHYERIRLATQS